MKFLDQYLNRLSELGGKPQNLSRSERRRMARDPRFQRLAQQAGVQRRLKLHRDGCMNGYANKLQLVGEGRGRHSAKGIPQAVLALIPAPGRSE